MRFLKSLPILLLKTLFWLANLIVAVAFAALFQPGLEAWFSEQRFAQLPTLQAAVSTLTAVSAPLRTSTAHLLLVGMLGLLVGWWANRLLTFLQSRRRQTMHRTAFALGESFEGFANAITVVLNNAPHLRQGPETMEDYFHRELMPIKVTHNAVCDDVRRETGIKLNTIDDHMTLGPDVVRHCEMLAAYLKAGDLRRLKAHLKALREHDE